MNMFYNIIILVYIWITFSDSHLDLIKFVIKTEIKYLNEIITMLLFLNYYLKLEIFQTYYYF